MIEMVPLDVRMANGRLLPLLLQLDSFQRAYRLRLWFLGLALQVRYVVPGAAL